jgi:SAM-dependent methyltransferase
MSDPAQVKHWDNVAPGWATWYEWTAANFRPLNRWFADAAGWKPGARALDIASGAGWPALEAASLLEPGGTMTATDVSAGMITELSSQARLLGITNVDFATMDAEALRFEDRLFDVVTNAYGLMFCPDPLRAVKETYRVLKSGGRAAFLTWDEPVKSPFFTVIFGVAAPLLAIPEPAPGTPGPFSLASAAHLESLLRDSGFSDVRVESRSTTFECASAGDYCRIFGDLAWRSRMASLSEADLALFRTAVAAAARPFTRDGRLSLVASSLGASGRRP